MIGLSGRAQVLAVAVPALAALLARLITGPHPIDDAYITFRYARNLGEGLGLVYNPGEWVLGTTAPLWAILLSGGFRVGFVDLPWLATCISAVCDAASAGLLVRFGLRMGWAPPAAAFVGLAWAANPMSIAFATGGMETSLFVLLALAALTLVSRAGPRSVVRPVPVAEATPLAPAACLAGASGVAVDSPGTALADGCVAGAVVEGGAARAVVAQDSRVRAVAEGSAGAAVAVGGAAVAAVAEGRAINAVGDGRAVTAFAEGPDVGGASLAAPLLVGTAEPSSLEGAAPAVLAAAVAGVATFIRPEGVLLATVVVGWTFFRHRRHAVAAMLAAVVPIAVGGAATWLRYGSPLPHSVMAKQVAYAPTWPFENALALLIQAGLPGWSTYLLGVLPSMVGVMLAALGLAALIGLAWAGLTWLDRRDACWQPFAAFAVLYLTFYLVVGLRGVRLFPWYLVPIEPFYLLAAAAGLARLATSIRSLRLGFPAVRLGGRGLAALLVLWQFPAIDWRQPLLPVGEGLHREALLLDVGRGLGEALPPAAVIAAPEIGAIGYASNLHMLDTVGLVSPEALPYYPLPPEQLVVDNAIPAKLIVDQCPDAVVTLDAFAKHSMLTDPAFQQAYRLERSYPVKVWQSDALLVFHRMDRCSQ